MSNIVEEVKEVISPEDLANALKNKVEDSKKEKQEKLVQLAYSYVKVISKFLLKFSKIICAIRQF